MRLFRNKVRIRKRICLPNAMSPNSATSTRVGGRGNVLAFIAILQLMLYFGTVVNGEVIGGVSGASSFLSLNSGLSVSSLGTFLVIYSAIPQFANTKSIRNGKEVEDEVTFVNATTVNSMSTPQLGNETVANVTQDGDASVASPVFSSRTLMNSEENTTLTPSEEMELNLDYSSEELQKKTRKGFNRLKRQMGMAAEIALIAPALQTMGCIPKFFCGMNTKPPTQESSALNDLAYLIKFAMLDDDELDADDPLFVDKGQNNRGKDGLTRVKEDLILENMAEEELIKEDPGNLAFVWKDMETRIKTKTKPGSKLRIDDLMDEIIIEPEQSAVGSIFSGIKSVLRIGRSVDHVLSKVEGQGNESSQATPRSGRSERVVDRRGPADKAEFMQRRKLRLRQRWNKKPFWTTPQFRQDMELAERIGKTEQDEQKCSTTFSVCPYTVHEMMEIVHGGYNKKRKQMKKKKKPEWYINADGPPQDSSEEEDDADSTKKPVKDPDNLITTTTEKTKWYPNDPENQLYYSLFPHKAVEQGMTTVPTTTTTKRPRKVVKTKTREKDTFETVYDIGPRPPMREHRRPPINIQGHVEYENDDSSAEKNKPEHGMMHNKIRHELQQHPPPPKKSSWFSFGGNKRPQQRPSRPHQQQQRPNGHNHPGGRPRPHGLRRPQNDPVDIRGSKEEEDNNDDGPEDNLDDSSEEHGNRKDRNKGIGSSDSAEEDEENAGSSEETISKIPVRPMQVMTTPTPEPPPEEPITTIFQLPLELQSGDPNVHILGIQPILENGGDLVPTGLPKQPQRPQPLQPFFQEPVLKDNTPIALPRPKYKIVKERKQKKKRKLPQSATDQQPNPPEQQPKSKVTESPKESKKEDKSNEASDEEEEDEESRENSSEEKNEETNKEVQVSLAATAPSPRGPTLNVILHGRPSEELNEPPKQHMQTRPYPGNNDGHSGSAEDATDNSDEENGNSNSAAVEATSKEISEEMAKIPKPARPPPPHFRGNSSNEYTYSDENDGHPPGSMRPISYSYFNKRPRDEHKNGGPPPPPSPSQQAQPSTTQKYSTGFLSFFLGKNKKPPRGSMENAQANHQHQLQYPLPVNSEEDAADDDDDNDDDSSEERDTRQGIPTLTSPEGKYEVGHLNNKPPPKFITPDFRPPQRPQRPYRGSTSMEDSDEKRGRSTPAPPATTPTQPTTTKPPKPLIFIGNPFKTIIPPPATPPQRHPSPSPTQPVTTEKSKKDSEEDDDPESDEKGSEESKEDDDENSSEEKVEKKKATKKKTSNNSESKNTSAQNIPFPPVLNYNTEKQTPTAVPTTTTTKKTSASTNKKRADTEDSNQSKEDDSAENNKGSKEDLQSDEDSDEGGSSEENDKKKQSTPRPPPRRKPEDDELEHPSAQFPPQPPVVGDIAAVGEILGANDDENTDTNPISLYGADEVPAPPPLALQGFAPSLEIVVPTKAPLRVPPGVSLQQFYQANGPQLSGGPPAGFSPGGPQPLGLQPKPGRPLAPANPTSLLGLAQQANANNGLNNGANYGGNQGDNPVREPSNQSQQGIRNPLSQNSNRLPSQNNRLPSQQGQRGQQGQNNNRGQNNRRKPGNRNKPEGNKEDNSSEEGSSEEKEVESSEEKDKDGESSERENANVGGFDEAIESLGNKDDDDDDQFEKDIAKRPPPPPPIFTGSKEQKQGLKQSRPFLPRPVTPQPAIYYRPNPGRREPILKNQLKPTQLLQLQHPQRIRPPPMKQSPLQLQSLKPTPLLPMRPSAAANLRPGITQSFSVSHLLRPLLHARPAKRKPLDPKVVEWIKQTYGIPDLNGFGPNRSGLQSQDITGQSNVGKITSTAKPPSSSKADKSKRTKAKKQSSKHKASMEKPSKGSAERRNSGEMFGFTSIPTTMTTTGTTSTTTSTTTGSTSTTAASTTTTKLTEAPTTPYIPPTTATITTTSTTSTSPSTTSTAKSTSTTTAKLSLSSTTTSNPPKRKLLADYITEYEEAEMAQALFSSEEERDEDDKDSDEEDDDGAATTKRYRTKVKTKVGGTNLVITVKSVVKKNKTRLTSSAEKTGKLPSKYGFSSTERKKLFLPITREKLKISSTETKASSMESSKKKHFSKSTEEIRRKTGSAEESLSTEVGSKSKLKNVTSKYSSEESKTKVITTTLNPKFVLGLRSTQRPRSKLKLPPIYGKHINKRRGQRT